jgi:restriction endonuclease S subunit
LDSIDDYLLKELGIELPENVSDERYFEVNIMELIGGRLDTTYYKNVYRRTFYVIEKFKTKLGNYITSINYGASVSNSYVEHGIPFLRIKDLLPNEIQKGNIVFLSEEMREQLLTSRVKKDDFLISRSGTIGVTAIVDEEFDNYAFGSFMIRFSINNINSDFLSYYINSTIGKLYFERNKIGAIQGNITIPTIRNLPVPDISIEKQNEIADHIQSIRTSAKQLQQKATEVLEKAKREAERIIEGKSVNLQFN